MLKIDKSARYIGGEVNSIMKCDENGNIDPNVNAPERVRKLQVEDWTYLQADDPCFSSRESQEAARVTLVTCVGYFQTPKRLAVETKVVEERTAF